MTINPQKLTLAMSRACMSSAELQREAAISDVTLCKIRNGTQKPRPATVGRIARALGIDPTEIIEQEAQP